MGILTNAWRAVREAASGFSRHHGPRLGAALAFYTLLSLSPLLLVVLAIVGAIFGPEAARGEITAQIEGLVGTEGAKAIEAMVASANRPERNILSMVVSVAVLLVGATGVFVELKGALDAVWETPPISEGWGIRSLLFDRLLAFALIGCLAFLLLVSLVFSAVLSAVGQQIFSGDAESMLLQWANAGLSFAMTAVMFAMIYRLLPTARPPWSRVWVGAAVTAVLFALGKMLIGLYLGRAAVGSAYGAAGSLVVLLIWVYFSTQILLFGAELTRAASTGVAASRHH